MLGYLAMDRSSAITRKTTLGDTDASFDRELRALTTPSQRFAETWKLSVEIWRLKGWNPGERGLSRSVARTVRG